jgi:predicted O-linked N-acetylglucosamine transferase (SPINDLY family)
MRGQFNHWRVIAGKSDAEAAQMVRDDEIDILIDLAGHTNRNRLPMFGLRPAPVQASWLGYWGTTGMATMDYVVLDAVSAPPGAEAWFREAIIRLPHGRFCYRAPDYGVEPKGLPSAARGYVTFGSFNNIAKITKEVLGLWGEILRAVPGSRMVLKWKSLCEASTRQRLLDAFASEGVAPERIDLRPAATYAQMLAEYNDDIDIALDTFPFGGGTTSCEALWMGVPVITLPGVILPSRQTLGFLTQMDMTELAANSPEDYVARAVALANDRDRLANLRRSLRPAFEASPICDGPKFTRTLEDAYRQMWRRHTSGEQPEAFNIVAGA